MPDPPPLDPSLYGPSSPQGLASGPGYGVAPNDLEAAYIQGQGEASPVGMGGRGVGVAFMPPNPPTGPSPTSLSLAGPIGQSPQLPLPPPSPQQVTQAPLGHAAMGQGENANPYLQVGVGGSTVSLTPKSTAGQIEPSPWAKIFGGAGLTKATAENPEGKGPGMLGGLGKALNPAGQAGITELGKQATASPTGGPPPFDPKTLTPEQIQMVLQHAQQNGITAPGIAAPGSGVPPPQPMAQPQPPQMGYPPRPMGT